jgi:hypothetical protein
LRTSIAAWPGATIRVVVAVLIVGMLRRISARVEQVPWRVFAARATRVR